MSHSLLPTQGESRSLSGYQKRTEFPGSTLGTMRPGVPRANHYLDKILVKMLTRRNYLRCSIPKDAN